MKAFIFIQRINIYSKPFSLYFQTDVHFIRAHLVQISHTIRDMTDLGVDADISECNTVKITHSMLKLVDKVRNRILK